jgi:hypothetical protein
MNMMGVSLLTYNVAMNDKPLLFQYVNHRFLVMSQ